MAILPSASRPAQQLPPTAGEDECPWCDQPISRETFHAIRRPMIEEDQLRLAALTEQFARERAAAEAKAKSALEAVRAEATATLEAKLGLARREEKAAAEAALGAKIALMQGRLEAAEHARITAHDDLATLKGQHEAVLEQRLRESEERLAHEREAAVLAERAKAFDEAQRMHLKLQELQRQLEGKSAHELGETSEIDLFEQLRGAFEGD